MSESLSLKTSLIISGDLSGPREEKRKTESPLVLNAQTILHFAPELFTDPLLVR